MTKNLNANVFRDEEPIPEVKSNEEWIKAGKECKPAWCYYNNNPEYNEKFGKLYNWHAINSGKLAPKGWRLPDLTDWNNLISFLIANNFYFFMNDQIAKAMAAKTDWNTTQVQCTIGNDLTTNNKSGFTALPGGGRIVNGDFDGMGDGGVWWCNKELDTLRAYCLGLSYRSIKAEIRNCDKISGFSVRLLHE